MSTLLLSVPPHQPTCQQGDGPSPFPCTCQSEGGDVSHVDCPSCFKGDDHIVPMHPFEPVEVENEG